MRRTQLVSTVLLLSVIITGFAGTNAVLPGNEAMAMVVERGQSQKGSRDQISPDDIRSGYFKIDGVSFRLPAICQEFLNQGWELDPAHSAVQLAPGDSLMTELRRNGSVIYITIGNSGTEKKPLASLSVIEMTIIMNPELYSPINIVLPKDVPLTNGAMEAIIAAHGDADFRNSSGPGNPYYLNVFVYWDPSDHDSCIRMEVDNPDYPSNITRVTINSDTEFFARQEALIKAGSTIAEPTKEVADYQAPTELGNDITSGIIEFEGDLYQMPAPVSAFQKNDWNLIPTFPSELEAGGYQTVYLTRGDKEISLFISNLGTETTVHGNCFTVRLDTSTPSLKIAGIEVGTSREALLSVIQGMSYEYDPEYFYNGDADMYMVNFGDSDDFIRFAVSDETNTVENIYIMKEVIMR